MATYTQFLNSHKRETKRAYWVCGPERRLVEEVVDHVVRRVGADDLNDVRFVAGETPDHDVWAALNQYTPEAEPRVVIVREAERIQNWNPFVSWYGARELSATHALFVSSEESTDTDPDHMRLIVSRGKFVKCGPFRQEKHFFLVLRAHAKITESAARLLMERTRGNMSMALDFLAKCRLISPGEIDERVVIALTVPAPADNFVDALLRFRFADALEAARNVDSPEMSAIIGLLDYKLDCLSRLYRALRRADRFHTPTQAQRTREIIRSSRLEPFVVAELLSIARRYDPQQVRTSLEALALVDSALSDGETLLILEVLVALWGMRR